MDDTLLLLSLSLPLFLLALYCVIFYPSTRRRNLPPGPAAYPLIGNLLWLRNSLGNFESVIRDLRHKYGKILTLHIGSQPSIFVFDQNLAHKFLVQHGSVFASRPSVKATAVRLIGNDSYNINNAVYGPIWRLLRRNLVSEILHPSTIKSYSDARSWVLGVVLDKIGKQSEEEEGGPVVVKHVFQYAMFCLLVSMCFGEKFEEKVVMEVESVQRELLMHIRKIQIFRLLPKLAPYLFSKRWKTMMDIRNRQKQIFSRLIDSRRDQKKKKKKNTGGKLGSNCFDYCYLDSLLELKLPEDNGRSLTEDEITGLCSEFLTGGTDTTSTALEWVMANVVKHRHIQEKLLKEIRGVVVDDEAAAKAATIEEDDLQKMPYLKAVIMEGLRRHPPGHFVLPHAVTEDTVVDGYFIPKDASINFMVADMGWDARLWKEPLDFKPERFLPGGEAQGVDVTCGKDIKMMPFGVGRRICPGLSLALLHLEYFVANLVGTFDWKQVDGEEIDFTEKTELTVVMNNPLRSRVTPHHRA